jgi:hypothetical protein
LCLDADLKRRFVLFLFTTTRLESDSTSFTSHL